MTLPGTSVAISDEAVPRFVPPSTGAWHVVGMTERGPAEEAVSIRSLGDYVTAFGERVAYGSLYDALDVFFREGGSIAHVGRVIGPTPVLATADIFDQAGSTAGDVALTFTAKEYGDWANSLDIEAVYDAATVYFIVKDGDGNTLETSPVFTTRAEAVAWESAYGTLALGASNELPRDQTASLATGTDDHSNATEAEWAAALALLDRDLGPGQVSAPGRTTVTSRLAVAAHALDRNRIALLDADDTAVIADLETDASGVRGEDGDRFSAMLWPWAVVPGVLAGTTRTVPYSAVQAGLIARSEALGNNPNVPAAGALGVSRYATGLSQDAIDDDDRETLNDAGIIVARVRRGVVQTYGYRTLADPSADEAWVALGGSRVVSAIKAEFEEIAERFLFAQMDGRGFKFAEYGGELAAVCARFYDVHALYGDTPEDAYVVDVGDSVNTPATIAAGQLKAKANLRTSPFAERVEIDIHRVRTADAV